MKVLLIIFVETAINEIIDAGSSESFGENEGNIYISCYFS